MRDGPAVQPDGELRDLQSAVTGGNIGWVGHMLAPELLPVRSDLKVDARRRLATRLIQRLAPLFTQGVVITHVPEVTEQLDADGYYVSSTGSVEATITLMNTHNGGAGLEDWARNTPADTALPAPPAPIRLLTRWRSEGERWLLIGLALLNPDGSRWDLEPVLDPLSRNS
ncbi:MAG: hypothetical protein AB7K09_03690 [Planctomycetota bacterium]